jgi:hypothetical protein
MDLKNAILETLAYSDVFDYPLTLDELHRFLGIPAKREDVLAWLPKIDSVQHQEGYYFISDHKGNVELRKKRKNISKRIYRRAIVVGQLLGKLPFIRMVALTGSLAVHNSDETADYDYMLVTKPGRLWMARLLALVLNKIVNIFSGTLCPNLIVTENALEWTHRNLYSAREIAQMVLICGGDVYQSFLAANEWVDNYLPNWRYYEKDIPKQKLAFIQKLLEWLLDGKPGDRFEAWEMNRKIQKLSKQAGFGTETIFTPDICQGNFDHHGLWAMQKYKERLEQLKATL